MSLLQCLQSCRFFYITWNCVLVLFLIMAALRSRRGHYIFVLWFLSSIYLLLSFFYSSPNLSGRRLDVYHTSAHGVALVRI